MMFVYSSVAVLIVAIWIRLLGRPRSPKGIIKVPYMEKLNSIIKKWEVGAEGGSKGGNKGSSKGSSKGGGKGSSKGSSKGGGKGDGKKSGGKGGTEGSAQADRGNLLRNRLQSLRPERSNGSHRTSAKEPSPDQKAMLEIEKLRHKAQHGTAAEKEALRVLGLL